MWKYEIVIDPSRSLAIMAAGRWHDLQINMRICPFGSSKRSALWTWNRPISSWRCSGTLRPNVCEVARRSSLASAGSMALSEDAVRRRSSSTPRSSEVFWGILTPS
jgi:hypothetical protein